LGKPEGNSFWFHLVYLILVMPALSQFTLFSKVLQGFSRSQGS
jgi:hypothetical protein